MRATPPVLKRLGRALVREGARTLALLALVTLAMFALLDMVPGDALALYANVETLSPAEAADARRELGLDRSLPVRYGVWLGRLARGDLGTSLRSGRPVAHELWTTGWRTLLLTGSAMLLTLVFASISATLGALGRRPLAAACFTLVGYVFSALPVFWLGYLAIYVATTRFGVFPVFMGGDDASWALFLVPVVVLGLGNGTVSEVTRHLRNHLEGVLREDYMRTAQAKGVRLWRHLYKDGFVMPLSSLIATKIPYLLGGAIVVEQVFNWPGMGRLAWQAASDRDFPVLLGVALFSAVIVRLGYLLREAVQVAVNPQLAVRA